MSVLTITYVFVDAALYADVLSRLQADTNAVVTLFNAVSLTITFHVTVAALS